MTSLLLSIKNIFSAALAVIMFIPIVLTMGQSGSPDTATEAYNGSNKHITNSGAYIAAHRCGGENAPQNTLMAFEEMVAQGENSPVDIIEFDVQITADGELVLQHDLTYDNTTNAAEVFGRSNVLVSSLTLEQARQLNCGENFCVDGQYPYRGLRGDDIPYNIRVATCDEVIDYILENSSKDYSFLIEIKSIGTDGKRAADKLYSIIKERGLEEKTVWSTFAPFTATYMETSYPEISRTADAIEAVQFYFYFRLGLDLQDVSPSYEALQIPYGSSAFDNIINLGTRELINYAHKNDIAVEYWTINSAEEIRELYNNGADCIITDNPSLAAEVIASGK